MRTQSIRYILLSLSVFAISFCSNAQAWKTYPHHQAGSVLTFPNDEGYHPGEVVEWWYTNAHLKGDVTGTDYALMLTYFYYDTLIYDGFRIFELSNENTGQFITETQPCTYPTLAQDHLEIVAKTGLFGTGNEEWKTLRDSANNLIPFQYRLKANMPGGSLDLTYNAIKRPLMVGGTGFLYEGITGYTYYYSETEIQVTGTITMNGVTESVHGKSWIDRQWGQFDPNNGEQYTWMSLQLSNGMDFNLWNIFNIANQIPDTSTYRFCSVYINDSTDMTMSDFTLDRLKYEYTADLQRCYDQKWHFTRGNVDLTITATHINNEVTLPFRFFEGSALIEGTIDGTPVTGVGYIELLHSFAKPQITITSPVGHVGWLGTTPITWKLTNPEDGRPIYYDVEVSTDNKVTYTTIAPHLTDTSYLWSPSLTIGTEGWFRITGYSIDTTLINSTVSANSFIFGVTGISELNTTTSVTVFPNPATSTLNISLAVNQKQQLQIFNSMGMLVKEIPITQTTQINIVDLPSGLYFIHPRNNTQQTEKFVKQ